MTPPHALLSSTTNSAAMRCMRTRHSAFGSSKATPPSSANSRTLPVGFAATSSTPGMHVLRGGIKPFAMNGEAALVARRDIDMAAGVHPLAGPVRALRRCRGRDRREACRGQPAVRPLHFSRCCGFVGNTGIGTVSFADERHITGNQIGLFPARLGIRGTPRIVHGAFDKINTRLARQGPSDRDRLRNSEIDSEAVAGTFVSRRG